MLVVDLLNKHMYFGSLGNPFWVQPKEEMYIVDVIDHYDVAKSTIVGRNKTFTNGCWREFFGLRGTKLKMSFSYHH